MISVNNRLIQFYNSQIHFLIQEKNVSYGLCVDLTTDEVIARVDQKLELSFLENQKSISEWINTKICKHLAYTDEILELKKYINRTRLLEKYVKGEDHFAINHYFLWNNGIHHCQMKIYLFNNPINQHIQAYLFWENDTENYIDSKIRNILYQNDYKALALIDIKHQNVYLRLNHFNQTKEYEKKYIDYKEIIDFMAIHQVSTKNKEQFVRLSSLSNLKENMNYLGHYSFKIINEENRIERYTYYWFDQEKEILLCVIDDMTRELEIDSVTGAYTREGFFNQVGEIINRNPTQDFSILYFNVVDFKVINDLYGSEVGDNILRGLVNYLQDSFLKPIVLARMVADQFALLVNTKNIEYEKFFKFLKYVYQDEKIYIDIYGKCGIYHIPKNTKHSIADMCDRAKLAKKYISNRYVKPYAVYDEKMKNDYEEKSMSFMQLDKAIDNKEIQIYYQPIYDAKTEEVVSAEALVRWHSPTNGVILPGKFIPALEESGHISVLDAFVYQSVIEFIEKECKNMPIKISINLSRMDLMNQSIMTLILENKYEKHINYEVTESAYASLSKNANDFLTSLHQRGNMILVDDFGSGVSSLSTIRDFEFDIIKIDMGFIRNIGHSKSNDSILVSLIEMIHRLGMKVVAEGVETKEQLEFLKENDCDYIQGYYFSKPLIQNDFIKLITH